MKKRDTSSRQGLAAVELGLMLPVMALLLFLLVEGASAMHAYSDIVEASREGARMALMDGVSPDIEGLVQSVTNTLDPDFLTTSVITGTDTVTVEVSYAYQPFGEEAFKMLTGEKSLMLVAQTTMPLP